MKMKDHFESNIFFWLCTIFRQVFTILLLVPTYVRSGESVVGVKGIPQGYSGYEQNGGLSGYGHNGGHSGYGHGAAPSSYRQGAPQPTYRQGPQAGYGKGEHQGYTNGGSHGRHNGPQGNYGYGGDLGGHTHGSDHHGQQSGGGQHYGAQHNDYSNSYRNGRHNQDGQTKKGSNSRDEKGGHVHSKYGSDKAGLSGHRNHYSRNQDQLKYGTNGSRGNVSGKHHYVDKGHKRHGFKNNKGSSEWADHESYHDEARSGDYDRHHNDQHSHRSNKGVKNNEGTEGKKHQRGNHSGSQYDMRGQGNHGSHHAQQYNQMGKYAEGNHKHKEGGGHHHSKYGDARANGGHGGEQDHRHARVNQHDVYGEGGPSEPNHGNYGQQGHGEGSQGGHTAGLHGSTSYYRGHNTGYSLPEKSAVYGKGGPNDAEKYGNSKIAIYGNGDQGSYSSAGHGNSGHRGNINADNGRYTNAGQGGYNTGFKTGFNTESPHGGGKKQIYGEERGIQSSPNEKNGYGSNTGHGVDLGGSFLGADMFGFADQGFNQGVLGVNYADNIGHNYYSGDFGMKW